MHSAASTTNTTSTGSAASTTSATSVATEAPALVPAIHLPVPTITNEALRGRVDGQGQVRDTKGRVVEAVRPVRAPPWAPQVLPDVPETQAVVPFVPPFVPPAAAAQGPDCVDAESIREMCREWGEVVHFAPGSSRPRRRKGSKF